MPVHFLLPLKMTDEEAAELLSWELPENFKLRINCWLLSSVPLLAVKRGEKKAYKALMDEIK